MGEISFRYMRKYEPVYEAVFKYWFADSKEYSFAYQRYIALSDTSIFNDPVAISKVATGFYSLHDLFVDKVVHPMIEQNTIEVHKDGKSFIPRNIIIGVHKEGYRMSIQDPVSILDRIGNDFLSIYKGDILLFKEKPELNITDTFNMSVDDKEIVNNIDNIVYVDKYNLLKIYNYDDLLKKITGSNLNIYHNIYNLRKTNIMNIFEDDVLCRTPRIGLNIYSNAILSRDIFYGNAFSNITAWTDRNSVERYWNGLASKPINIGNCTDSLSCSPKYLLYTNIISLLFGYIPNPVGNIIEQIYAKKSDLQTELNKTLDVIVSNKQTNFYDILSSPVSNRIGNAYNILFGEPYKKHSWVDYYTISGITDKKYAFQTYSIFTEKLIETKQVFTTKGCRIIKYPNALCKFDIDTFAIVKEKYAFTLDGIFSITDIKDAMVQSGVWQINSGKNVFETSKEWLINSYKNISIQYDNDFALKHEMNANISNKLMFGSKYNKNVFTTGTVFSNNNVKNIFTTDTVFSNNNAKNIFITTGLFIGNLPKDISTDDKNEFVMKYPISITIHDSGLFIDNIPKPIWLTNDNVDVINNKKSFGIYDTGTNIHKVPYQIQIHENGLNITKKQRLVFLYRGEESLYKKTLEINTPQEDIWVLKDAYDLSTFNQLFVDKDKRIVSIYQQAHFVLKECVSFGTSDITSVIKDKLPLDIIGKVSSEYEGVIIPVSKVRHQAFIDRIDEMVHKYSKDIYITHGVFSSVLSKDIYCDEGLFFDKDEHKIFIDYKNEMITKSKVYGFMHGNIFIDKQKQNAYIETILNATKESKRVWIEDINTVSKAYHEGLLHQNEFIIKDLSEVYIPDSLFVDKIDKICYYDYGAFADKSEYRIMLHQDELALRDKKSMHLADLVPQAIKESTGIFYDYEVFSNRIIKECDLYREINSVEKIVKEIMLHPDDFGNWAWVYETPDPIDVTYGIDELLLPENDTRYADFEDIIFNKKTMKPRSPVKIINDTTFIAKYPHKHPIPEYSDVAVNYDDSAVKYEQYFGIETEIMHKVFLKYYRIWQSKIFEFGTMTMVQSVKKMLEYLYAWIMIYFPPDELEQALRVFKLIRWYGESAIIQNSQYIVSYEYDTLESKLTTGTCAIPNNLDPTINDSMIIDASLGVIKNNPIYIGTNQDAYVEFYIDNRKNTSITFSLSNTVGSVNIYINDVLVDVISHSTLNMTYQIPYTGDVNVVKIEKPASHNLNQYFYIGNIKVPELSFKDLSIEFDATLKMGNKPLDEIAKKMIQYANLYDDFKDAYNNIKRSNLGIQETYKKMLEYWNLHHQGKTKGKRLTIKEV